ncbi:MAG: hypothetical protein ACR2NY_02870 [Alphaproteobacteria bacterium]
MWCVLAMVVMFGCAKSSPNRLERACLDGARSVSETTSSYNFFTGERHYTGSIKYDCKTILQKYKQRKKKAGLTE